MYTYDKFLFDVYTNDFNFISNMHDWYVAWPPLLSVCGW